jgi:hypothetical protein
LTGLPGRLGQFVFLKNQYDVVLEKKKTKFNDGNRVFDGVLPGQLAGPAGSYRVFFFLLFFLQPGPVPAPSRLGPGSTRRPRPSFKTMI